MYMVYCKDPNCDKCKQYLQGQIASETQSKFVKTVEELVSLELLLAAKEKAEYLKTCKQLKDEVQYKINGLINTLKDREYELCNQIDLEYATRVEKIDIDVMAKCTDKLLKKNSGPEKLLRKYKPIFICDYSDLRGKIKNFGFVGYDTEEPLCTRVAVSLAAASTTMNIPASVALPLAPACTTMPIPTSVAPPLAAASTTMPTPASVAPPSAAAYTAMPIHTCVAPPLAAASTTMPTPASVAPPSAAVYTAMPIPTSVAPPLAAASTAMPIPPRDKNPKVIYMRADYLNGFQQLDAGGNPMKNPELQKINEYYLKKFQMSDGKAAESVQTKNPELQKMNEEFLKEVEIFVGNVAESAQTKNPDGMKESQKFDGNVAESSQTKNPELQKMNEEFLKEVEMFVGNVAESAQTKNPEQKINGDKFDGKASDHTEAKNPELQKINGVTGDCLNTFQMFDGKVADNTQMQTTEMKLDKKDLNERSCEDRISDLLNIGKNITSMQQLLQTAIREQKLAELGANQNRRECPKHPEPKFNVNIQGERRECPKHAEPKFTVTFQGERRECPKHAESKFNDSFAGGERVCPKPADLKNKDTSSGSSDEDGIEFINRSEVANIPSGYTLYPPLPPKAQSWFGMRPPCMASYLPLPRGFISEVGLKSERSGIVENESSGHSTTLENGSTSSGYNTENASVNEQKQEFSGIGSNSEDPSAVLLASFVKYLKMDDINEWLAPKESSEHLLSSGNYCIFREPFVDKKDVDLYEWLPKKK